MRLPGHSGCSFEFMDKKGLVRKSTEGSLYSPIRFEKQIEKQKQFYRDHLEEGCHYKTPYVYGLYYRRSHISAVMELIDGVDPIEFLQYSSDYNCRVFFNLLIGLVNEYFEQSDSTNISRSVLSNKYDSVIKQLPEDDVKWIDMLWRNDFCPDDLMITIPAGPCHGDLTLSNVIVYEDNVVLLDFMDTYFDSPIQDIVKLRQDTKHHWTLFRYPGKIRHAKKIMERLEILDQMIISEWPAIHFWKYNAFQFLNLIRILPYAKEQATVDWVLQEIMRIK